LFVPAVVWERPRLHNSELEAKRDALQEEIAVTVELTQNAVAENARVAQDQDDYNKRYNALVERYDRLKAQYDEVSTAISDNEARYEQMGRFITVLKDQEGVITEFDDALWSSLNCRKEQGRCDGGIQRRHRNESRIRYEADTTLRIYVLGVFAMCTKCKFRDE